MRSLRLHSLRRRSLEANIESSSISNSSYASSTSAARSARLTARIPSEKLDGYLAGISKQSNVTRKSESTEDVTLQYVDLQSHKKALLAEQESLLSMMEQANPSRISLRSMSS